MKKLLLLVTISCLLTSCRSSKDKDSQNSNESAIIGYEFNKEGEKLNLIAGDIGITDLYLEYIQAHNDKNSSKIFEMDTDDIIVKAANGLVFNGRKAHKKELDAWFTSSSPIWKVKWMIANTVQGKDGKNQSWLTTGVDVIQTLDGNNITSHHVVDINFVNGKIKELNAYDRASEK